MSTGSAAGRTVLKGAQLIRSTGSMAGNNSKRLNYNTAASLVSLPPSLVQVMSSRAVQPDPRAQKLGNLLTGAVVVAGIYAGGKLAEYGATFLEENEIFVPADDDDDD